MATIQEQLVGSNTYRESNMCCKKVLLDQYSFLNLLNFRGEKEPVMNRECSTTYKHSHHNNMNMPGCWYRKKFWFN